MTFLISVLILYDVIKAFPGFPGIFSKVKSSYSWFPAPIELMKNWIWVQLIIFVLSSLIISTGVSQIPSKAKSAAFTLISLYSKAIAVIFMTL